MPLLETLRSILDKQYRSEDGELYSIQLLPPMTATEISAFKKKLPKNFLSPEIEALLKFCRGFIFSPLGEIRFDAFDTFGFQELLPFSIQLADDGAGNFWVLDIDSNGVWGNVYYVCHDPPVIIKQSENLADFILDVSELGEKGASSRLEIIREKTAFNIWQEKTGIMQKNEKDDYDFGEVTLPEVFMIADLSDMPLQTGFAWGKFGADAKIIRPGDAPVWVIEKKIKQGFLARLFNFQR